MRRSLADRPVVAGKHLLAGVGVEPRGRLIKECDFDQLGDAQEEEEGHANVASQAVRLSKQQVWEAYRQVAANKGAPGVDGQDLEAFEADLKGNLYKIGTGVRPERVFDLPVGVRPR